MMTSVVAGSLRANGKFDVLGLYNNDLVVFLGNGDGTFAPAVSYPFGNNDGRDVVTLGDFNGDNKLDVLVTLSGSEIVFLGNGDGTLQSSISSTGFSIPVSVVVSDFNGDGNLDIVVSDSQTGATWILLGNGDGTFGSGTMIFASDGDLVAADMNGDGKEDLVFAGNLLQVYLGHGDGTFGSPTTYEIAYNPEGLSVADFNGDHKPDVAVAGEIFLGDGDGALQGPPATAVPSAIGSAVLGDFDNNGTLDVALSTGSILLNDGSGILTVAHTYPLQQSGEVIASADLNNDGNLDLVLPGSGGYYVLLGNGDGSFQMPMFTTLNGGGTDVVIADFNGDGKPDLAFQSSGGLLILLGNGDGTFGPPTSYFDGMEIETANSIVAADFNNDGKLDIAAGGNSGLAILFGNGDGTFKAATFISTADASGGILAGDLNGDGDADLVTNYGGIQVFLGNGNGTFKALNPFGAPFYGEAAAFALSDINGDGIPDIVGVQVVGGGFSSSTYGVYLGNGDGTFGDFFPAYTFLVYGISGVLSQVGDMNRDGKPDLIFLGSSVNSVFVVFNTTNSGFNMSASAPAPSTVHAGSPATATVFSLADYGFKQTVNLSCANIMLNGSLATTGLPTCSFSPASIAGGAGMSTLTIGTTAASAMLSPAVKHPSELYYAMLLPFFGIVLTAGLSLKRKKMLGLVTCIMIAGLLFIPACGGSGGGSGGGGGGTTATPAGTYTITVTGTSGSTVSSTTVTLTVQ
jgi:hypothetical protein